MLACLWADFHAAARLAKAISPNFGYEPCPGNSKNEILKL